ncbi:hypothetical protein BDF19DRAFT_205697 [Syncephalis fuscata]|nr:hypothetical protein BDF19DRAFT_205697 [Syncephalis fuscata]
MTKRVGQSPTAMEDVEMADDQQRGRSRLSSNSSSSSRQSSRSNEDSSQSRSRERSKKRTTRARKQSSDSGSDDSRDSSRSRSRSRSRADRKQRQRRRSRSSSPPPEPPRVFDMDPVRRRERERQLAKQYDEAEPSRAPSAPMDSTEERIKLAFTTRTGGAYIPPARLKAMQEQITDKNSREYQRLDWEQLKKNINGLVNKVNTTNIKIIAPELFKTNLIRGRGLFARSIMKAQAAALPFTPVYAALIAVLNTRMPQIGELVLSRLIVQFRRAYKRNDKGVCLSSTTFISHLCNQQVAHEIAVLQMLALLLERPTDDSVEIAVGLMRECGAFLSEASSRATNAVFERFRGILHEAQIDKRIQYMIEVLFQVRRDKFKDNPAVPEELDIVEEEDQITHTLSLDDELDIQEGLGVFKFDPEFQENEEKYAQIRAEILGEDSSGSGESGSEEENESEEDSEAEGATQALENQLKIHDRTETNLLNLRRTIYLTIMSSVDFEECAHKLMKIQLQEGEEFELCSMIMECCSQERTYFKFYGLLCERFCKINKVWADATARLFVETYETIHRFETNRLRNIAKLFAHVLSTDGITWSVMSCFRLTEEETTASSRIFIKILFQEICEALGLKQLNDRLKDPVLSEAFNGIFPVDNPKNTRFAINYFTSIGLGGLTEELREHLKNAPKLIMAQQRLLQSSSDSSDSDSSSSDDSDSDSSSSDSGSDSGSGSSGGSSSSSGSSESESSSEDSDDARSRRRRPRDRQQHHRRHNDRSISPKASNRSHKEKESRKDEAEQVDRQRRRVSTSRSPVRRSSPTRSHRRQQQQQRHRRTSVTPTRQDHVVHRAMLHLDVMAVDHVLQYAVIDPVHLHAVVLLPVHVVVALVLPRNIYFFLLSFLMHFYICHHVQTAWIT